MTKEIYNKLDNKDFRLAFFYAVHSSCIPAFTKGELDILEGAYQEVLGKTLGKNRSCGHCVLTMVKELAKEFYNYETEQKSTEGNEQTLEDTGGNDGESRTTSESGSDNPTTSEKRATKKNTRKRASRG